MAGVLAAGGWWVHATTEVQEAVNDFSRTRSAFGGVVELVRPGTHTFWIEGDCLSCVGNGPEEYRQAATVAVTGPDGKPVTLEPAADRLYNTGGNEGRALWTFEATDAGPHRITLGFDTSGTWDNRLPGRIAVGEGDGLPARIAAPMGWIVGAAIAGAVAWALGWRWRRERWFRSQVLADRRSREAGSAPNRPR